MKLRPVDLDELALVSRSHSIFAPSSAVRWMHCAGSLVPNVLAEDDPSYIAAEGTAAHGVAEKWLKTGRRPLSAVGTTVKIDGFVIEITREMLDHVEVYVNYCNELPGRKYIEHRVDISRWMPIPNQRGTGDFATVYKDCAGRWILEIVDLKYGMDKVKADTPQLSLYALGWFEELDFIYNFDRVVMNIVQPRLDHIDRVEISRDELMAFGGEARAAARRAWQIDAPRLPSAKACQYCSEKDVCPARVVWFDRLARGEYAHLSLEVTSQEMLETMEWVFMSGQYGVEGVPAVPSLTLADMGYILPHKPMIEAWLKAMKEVAEREAIENHARIPNMKLVLGRGSREFTTEEARLMAKFEDMGIPYTELFEPQKLISPAKAEGVMTRYKIKKEVRAVFMSENVKSNSGAPTLAPLTDRRAVYNDGRHLMDDIEDDDDEAAGL